MNQDYVEKRINELETQIAITEVMLMGTESPMMKAEHEKDLAWLVSSLKLVNFLAFQEVKDSSR